MTREDSILTKTWVTNDGRYLSVTEIADDHLLAIRGYLQQELTIDGEVTYAQLAPEGDEARRAELDAWMTAHAAGAHALEDEMDHDLFRTGWIRIVGEEIARRSS